MTLNQLLYFQAVAKYEHFRLAAKITRKFEKMAASIPMDKMDELMGKRNPNDSFELMFDTVFGK